MRILIPQDQIAARVRELGEELSRRYAGRRPLFLGVMNGALFFLADLVRALDVDVEISCVRLASYAGMHSTGLVRGLDDAGLRADVQGREVVIVDDVLDTGRTLYSLVAKLHEHAARDVKICVLLEKKSARDIPIRAEWVGFRIEDEFVVGYGLDHNGHHRGLNSICVLEPDASSAKA